MSNADPQLDAMKDFLAQAKTIAVVGASQHAHKEAHSVPAYMLKHGYRIIPVTPTSESLFGERAYKHLHDVPSQLVAELDGVVLFRPSDQAGEHVQAAIDLKLPLIWMQEGIKNQEWADRAIAAGITVIQDRCVRTVHMLYGPGA